MTFIFFVQDCIGPSDSFGSKPPEARSAVLAKLLSVLAFFREREKVSQICIHPMSSGPGGAAAPKGVKVARESSKSNEVGLRLET